MRVSVLVTMVLGPEAGPNWVAVGAQEVEHALTGLVIKKDNGFTAGLIEFAAVCTDERALTIELLAKQIFAGANDPGHPALKGAGAVSQRAVGDWLVDAAMELIP